MASIKRRLGNQLMTLKEKRGVYAYAPNGRDLVRVANVSPFDSAEWRRKRAGIADRVRRRAAANRIKSHDRKVKKYAIAKAHAERTAV